GAPVARKVSEAPSKRPEAPLSVYSSDWAVNSGVTTTWESPTPSTRRACVPMTTARAAWAGEERTQRAAARKNHGRKRWLANRNHLESTTSEQSYSSFRHGVAPAFGSWRESPSCPLSWTRVRASRVFWAFDRKVRECRQRIPWVR